MNQSKLESAIETVTNVGSGFITAFLVWQFIAAPLFGYEVTLVTNFWLTSIFTAVSIIRGYLWRRFFARQFHMKVHQFVGNFFRNQLSNRTR